eukprot:6185993-Amphidinium_carterae.2
MYGIEDAVELGIVEEGVVDVDVEIDVGVGVEDAEKLELVLVDVQEDAVELGIVETSVVEVDVKVAIEDVDELELVLVSVLESVDELEPVACGTDVAPHSNTRVASQLMHTEVDVEVDVKDVADDVVEVELEALVDVDVVELVVLNVEVEDDVLVINTHVIVKTNAIITCNSTSVHVLVADVEVLVVVLIISILVCCARWKVEELRATSVSGGILVLGCELVVMVDEGDVIGQIDAEVEAICSPLHVTNVTVEAVDTVARKQNFVALA